jgi:uncharacterized protein
VTDRRPARGSRTSSGDRLLILGVSARALAASACRSRRAADIFTGGIVALDYFGDADLRALERSFPLTALSLTRDLGRRRSTLSLCRAALDLDWRALAWSGGLENRPQLLRRLQECGAVLGNDAASVARLRDPGRLFHFLCQAGIPHARAWSGNDAAPPADVRCLWKPVRSGGGLRIREALPGTAPPRGHYLQEYLAGPVGSAAFVADGVRAVILGVTRQIIGWRALGGSGFKYGGNIAGPPSDLLPPGGLEILAEAAGAITRRFGLAGLNGIDYVLAGGVPRLIEVNPRYTAAMELFEELSGANFFDLHLTALADGSLPGGPLPAIGPSARFLGKAILYAGGAVRAGDPEALLELGCRDLPHRGEAIGAGQPICTLMAAGESEEDCRRGLLALSRRARRRLGSAQSPSPQVLPAHPGSW